MAAKALFFFTVTAPVVLADAWAPHGYATPPTSFSRSAARRRHQTIASAASLSIVGGADAPPAYEVTTPKGCYDKAVALGAAKANLPADKILALGILSGAHIALGAFLAVSVGGSVPMMKANNPGAQRILLGAFGLPMGLLMTLVAGGELFTGNTAVVTAAAMDGHATGAQLRKSWGWSFVGNLIGSVLVAFLAATAFTGVAAGATAVATGKVSCTFAQAFCRGLLCNWLVCMAVWMASGATSIVSKACAVFFPISGFVALGLDHSVANMFLIPFGMFLGADITVSQMVFKNIIPVTLGNIVGGALFVAAGYQYGFGKKRG